MKDEVISLTLSVISLSLIVNFDIADIYFPMFVIQVNWDIFPLRNRNYKNYNANSESKQQPLSNEDDLAILNHNMMREQYEQTCKIFFVLRD